MKHLRYVGFILLVPWMVFAGMPLTFSGYGFDEPWFLWEGWSVRQGLAPYVDFFDFKPPVLFLTEAAALSLGLDQQRFRLFFLGLVVVSVSALSAALLRRGAIAAYAVGFAVASLALLPALHDSSLNDVETIALSYYLLGLAGFVAGLPGPGAALLVLSVLTRESFVFLVLPTWGAFFARADRRDFLRSSVCGALVPFAAVCAYLACVGGLAPWLESYRRSLSFAASYAERIGRWDPGSRWGDQVAGHFWAGPLSLASLLPFSPFAVFGSVRSKLWGLTALAGAVYTVTIGHCFWCHYFVVLVGAFALWAALAAEDLTPARLSLVGAASVGLFALVTGLPSPTMPRPCPPPAASDVLALVRSTPKGAWVLSTTPGVYVWGGRRASLAQSAFLDELVDTYPGATDRDRFAAIRRELESRPPDVVVLDELALRRGQRHIREVLIPFMGDRYQQVGPDLFVRKP
jgi:hypothetical protein